MLVRRCTTRALVAVLGTALVLAGCARDEEPAAVPEPVVDAEEPVVEEEVEPELTARLPLTGVLVEDAVADALVDRPLLIAKVENSPAARPQAGLDVADVVVEELTEGGVTRFISLFHSTLPDQVGPVRSARPVDIAVGSSFGRPVFAYSGARAQVQGMLRASALVALEEGAPGFTRVPDRRRPHDLFIDPETVVAAGLERDATPLDPPGWVFAEEPPSGAVRCLGEQTEDCADPGTAVTVPMSHAARSGWTYDEAAGVYRRDQNGEPSLVTGEGRIGAANVVVLATRHYTDGCCDSNGSPYTETDVTGEGVALYWRDGQRFEGTWRKPEVTSPLELLDADGAPFPLKPGATWMHLPSASVVAGM